MYETAGQIKLLYEEINGILFDCFIYTIPSASYSLVALTKEVVFPEIRFILANSYSVLTYTIYIEPQVLESEFSYALALYSTFLIT